jgi:hypothetical protein
MIDNIELLTAGALIGPKEHLEMRQGARIILKSKEG